MKFIPTVVLSAAIIGATAVGATAANYAVLSQSMTLHEQSDVGGLAPEAPHHEPDPQSTDPNQPAPTSTGAVTDRPNPVPHYSDNTPDGNDDVTDEPNNNSSSTTNNQTSNNRPNSTATAIEPGVTSDPTPAATKPTKTKTPKVKPTKTKTPKPTKSEDDDDDDDDDDDSDDDDDDIEDDD